MVTRKQVSALRDLELRAEWIARLVAAVCDTDPAAIAAARSDLAHWTRQRQAAEQALWERTVARLVGSNP